MSMYVGEVLVENVELDCNGFVSICNACMYVCVRTYVCMYIIVDATTTYMMLKFVTSV